MAYAGALLTGVYDCLDRKDYTGLGVLLTAGARWSVLTGGPDPSPPVTGRDAVCGWLAATHPEPVRHTVTAVRDEGSAAAVFLDVVQATADGERASRWLDTYRFADGVVDEHLSLRLADVPGPVEVGSVDRLRAAAGAADLDAVAALLTPQVRLHLADGGVVAGRQAAAAAIAGAGPAGPPGPFAAAGHGEGWVESYADGVAVFPSGGTGWLESYRLEGGLVAELVALAVG